jgi:hypothetical protein
MDSIAAYPGIEINVGNTYPGLVAATKPDVLLGRNSSMASAAENDLPSEQGREEGACRRFGLSGAMGDVRDVIYA